MKAMFGPALVAVLLAGCSGNQPGQSPPTGNNKKHDHPTEGPHHGALVEWGDEEYHPEVVFDREKNEVRVYVLGKNAKTPTPIGSDKITLSNTDPPFQVELKPSPNAKDPKGKSSQFVGALPDVPKDRRLGGTLAAVVDGKPYSGDFREAPPHKD
jgi:hypothetical protein